MSTSTSTSTQNKGKSICTTTSNVRDFYLDTKWACGFVPRNECPENLKKLPRTLTIHALYINLIIRRKTMTESEENKIKAEKLPYLRMYLKNNLKSMREQWPCLTNEDEIDFWLREFVKHGYPAKWTVAQYFDTALRLHEPMMTKSLGAGAGDKMLREELIEKLGLGDDVPKLIVKRSRDYNKGVGSEDMERSTSHVLEGVGVRFDTDYNYVKLSSPANISGFIRIPRWTLPKRK